MDPQVFIDAARYAHILAVAIGFGAAFLADYHIISRLGRTIDDNLTTTLNLCHSVIWKMLIAMWLTGLILVQIRTGFVLENFTPKLICKVLTVVILTGNAMLISKIAVPLVEENRGRSLMWLPLGSKLCLAGIGAISSASWMLALAMGSSKVLAASGWVVFAVLMPFVYFSGVMVAVAVMCLLHMGGQMMAHRPANRVPQGAPADQRGPVKIPLNHRDASPLPQQTRARPALSTQSRAFAEKTRIAPRSDTLAKHQTPVAAAAERKVAEALQAHYRIPAHIAAE